MQAKIIPEIIKRIISGRGKYKYFKSIIDSGIRRLTIVIDITVLKISVCPFTIIRYNHKNPVSISMAGYCSDSLFLQLWHFPNCRINEIMGIFLYIGIGLLHFGQNDRGLMIDILLGIL